MGWRTDDGFDVRSLLAGITLMRMVILLESMGKWVRLSGRHLRLRQAPMDPSDLDTGGEVAEGWICRPKVGDMSAHLLSRNSPW